MKTTSDAFLGGRLTLEQPARGFRAGSDAVLLAAACPARPGDSVLDLGCGVGAAMYCLGARVRGLRLTGVERDRVAAELARSNGAADVVEGDVLALPKALRGTYDHVICNPPYFAPGSGAAASAPGRDAAMREGGRGELRCWMDVACRRAAPNGTVTFISRSERLMDLLVAMDGRLGAIAVRPVAARSGAEAGRVVVQGHKGRRGGLRLLQALVLHRGPAHAGDRDDHTDEAREILRDGLSLLM